MKLSLLLFFALALLTFPIAHQEPFEVPRIPEDELPGLVMEMIKRHNETATEAIIESWTLLGRHHPCVIRIAPDVFKMKCPEGCAPDSGLYSITYLVWCSDPSDEMIRITGCCNVTSSGL